MALGKALRSNLVVRLTLILALVTAVGMTVMAVYVTRALETHAVETLRSSLATEAALLQDAVLPLLGEATRPGPLQELAWKSGARSKARVTIVAMDGTVLGDSERTVPELLAMENHASRPEVRAALAGTVATDVRRSRTLDLEMLYVAIPVMDRDRVAGALRLALPLRDVARASTSIRRTVAGGAVLAFAVVCAVGLFVSRRVTRPVVEMRAAADRMATGDFDQTVRTTGRDEIAGLGQALNALARGLREKIAQLEAERAKVRAMLDGMVEGVIAVDRRGRILLANPAARALFELGAAPVEGRPLVEVVRQKALVDLVEACQAEEIGGGRRGELELGPPVDRTLEVHVVALDVPTEPRSLLLVLHDITELRRLERVRTEFVANVSHELRTPLTAIKGSLETLLDKALEEPTDARRFLEVADRHAERLGRLVDDLLQLSDIETGRAGLKPGPVVVHDVVREVAGIFEGRAAEKPLGLVTEVSPDLRVHADRDRLVQILVNLLDNALKHTPAGGRITLAAARGAPGFVDIRVTDTGVGIPSTDLPRLTERFYRVDRARSRELGGTGLGLAIVKHLVQAHGGELRIESELGKGTTVRVTLPAA